MRAATLCGVRAAPTASLLPWLLLLLWGCGAPQGPYFNDHRHLRFGVTPAQEADAIVASFEEAGHRLAKRLQGRDYTALAFTDRIGQPIAIRVVTRRGTQLALGSAEVNPLEPPFRHRLVSPPNPDNHDADGDGFEEIFIERSEGQEAEGCILVYRVRDVGFVDPVPMEAMVLGEELCVRDVRDLDGDGRMELLARLTPLVDGLLQLPQVDVPLWADEHVYRQGAGGAAEQAYLQAQQDGRHGELAALGSTGGAERRILLAVEISLLAELLGEDPQARLSSFDRAVGEGGQGAGVDEVAAQARAWLRARSPATQ